MPLPHSTSSTTGPAPATVEVVLRTVEVQRVVERLLRLVASRSHRVEELHATTGPDGAVIGMRLSGPAARRSSLLDRLRSAPFVLEVNTTTPPTGAHGARLHLYAMTSHLSIDSTGRRHEVVLHVEDGAERHIVAGEAADPAHAVVSALEDLGGRLLAGPITVNATRSPTPLPDHEVVETVVRFDTALAMGSGVDRDLAVATVHGALLALGELLETQSSAPIPELSP